MDQIPIHRSKLIKHFTDQNTNPLRPSIYQYFFLVTEMVFIQAFLPEKLHTSKWGRCWCCHLSVFLTNIIELWRKCSPIGRGWGRGQASAHAARRHRGLGSVAGVVFTRCSVSYTTVGKPSRSQKSESDRFPPNCHDLDKQLFLLQNMTWSSWENGIA